MEIQIEKMLENHLTLMNLNDFDDFWNINILREEILLPSSFYIIAKVQNIITGFAGINIVLDEAHLANIVVKKDKRELKIGSKLLENIIEIAKNKAKLITLEVNVNNSTAIHLYEKFDFKILGRRKKYYDNKYDAYIMTKYF